MKRASIAAMVIVLGAALAYSASAQRHDEKPHGSKPSAQSQESQYEPMPVEKQIVQIYAGTQKDKNGVVWIRNVEVSDVPRYMKELIEFIETRHPEVLKVLREKKDLSDDVRAMLDRALEEFKDVFRPTEQAKQAKA